MDFMTEREPVLTTLTSIIPAIPPSCLCCLNIVYKLFLLMHMHGLMEVYLADHIAC